MIVVGLFMAFVNNYYLAQAAGSASEVFWFGYDAWQWMYWMELIPASVFLAALVLVPESPRFLVAAGQEEQARSVLERLGTADDVDAKIADIRSTLEEERQPRLADVIQDHTGNIHPLVWVGIGLASLQQFTGINVVFYYGGTLWQAAGFTEASALLTNVVNGSVNVLFTFVAIALIDRVGRKPLLLVGSLGQALMLGIMAVIFGTAAQGGAGNLDMQGQPGADCAHRREWIHRLLCLLVGTHRVGHARRDVSQQVSRGGPLHLWGRAVALQLPRHRHLSCATGLDRPRLLVWNLCDLWGRSVFLRPALHRGDEGTDPGRHVAGC